MDYRQLFIDLLETLKQNRSIEVLNDYVGDPVPQDDYSYQLILDHFQIKLSKKLMAFYYSLSSCQIEWQCRLKDHKEIKKFYPDDSIVSGQIYIRPLEQLLEFDKKLEADWWMKNLSVEEKTDLYNFRYLDFNDDYSRVGFILQGDRLSEDKLYLITQDSEGFYPVDLSFDEYIKRWKLYKGYQGWQYNHFFQNTENHRQMMHYLEQLFT